MAFAVTKTQQRARETETERTQMVDYRFLKIEVAISSINQKVNLVAAIADSSQPLKSRGTDYFCKLKIIDESYPEYGMPVHLFAGGMDALPRVRSTGDIIRLSSVTINIHDGHVYAIYNKKFSSFALYEGKNGESFHPYQVSLRFHVRKEEEILIANLRKWLAHSMVIDEQNNFVLLRQMNLHNRINIACKVLHICKIANNEWIAFLWDGTDAPPISINEKLGEEMQNELPLHFETLPLSRHVLRTFPTFGTILKVLFGQDCEKYIHQRLKVGQWVKVFDLVCKSCQGLWYGVLTESTKIREMPNEDDLLVERQRKIDYRTRLSCKLEGMPYWAFPGPSRITGVHCSDDVPFATLTNLLTCQKAKRLKFRCVVRFVAVLPSRVEDFRDPCGTYRVRFTLEDPTARIHAFAFAKEGEKFFDGYPPADVLRSKVNRLLGVALRADGNEIADAARNPPWVECCLRTPSRKCCKICDTILYG